ncbi:integrase catalytic domain-containing protein [Trichonephila clavipes]|nr:integrase catalytic domain-containing protein [Trichonephila clavipes]
MSSNTRCSGLSDNSEGIQLLVWPARSPDLNPIENVWDALGRQVAGQNYPPTNKNTLIRALTEEWDKLPQQLLDNVVQNPPCPAIFTSVASNAQSQCPLCNAEHTLSRCDTFLKLSVQGRSDFVKTNVCFNCLTQFHSGKTCKSKFRCKKCKKPHHSLLHIENVSAKGGQGAVNVLNSRELSVNAPVFSPVPISSTSEPSEHSRVVDVTSCISDMNPDVQILFAQL